MAKPLAALAAWQSAHGSAKIHFIPHPYPSLLATMNFLSSIHFTTGPFFDRTCAADEKKPSLNHRNAVWQAGPCEGGVRGARGGNEGHGPMQGQATRKAVKEMKS
jgi:hypothetical protein